MPDFSASVQVDAAVARVFSLWSDPTGWPRWDPDLESASLEGPFEAGSTGRIKPHGGPMTRITLTDVQPGHAFTAEARLPLCRMVFEHVAESTGTGCTVTHTVHFNGPLAALFRRIVGRQIERGLPGTMAGLKVAAEASQDYSGAVTNPSGRPA